MTRRIVQFWSPGTIGIYFCKYKLWFGRNPCNSLYEKWLIWFWIIHDMICHLAIQVLEKIIETLAWIFLIWQNRWEVLDRLKETLGEGYVTKVMAIKQIDGWTWLIMKEDKGYKCCSKGYIYFVDGIWLMDNGDSWRPDPKVVNNFFQT